MNIPVPVPQTVGLTAHAFEQTIMKGIEQGLRANSIASIIDEKTNHSMKLGQIADLAQYINAVIEAKG
jgi:hypothetical protein